jgi:hypothetical protein
MEHHQWVRYQVLMAQLEKQLQGLLNDSCELRIPIEELARKQQNSDNLPPLQRYPYPRNQHWCEQTEEVLRHLLRLLSEWREEVYRPACPLPEPVLRVTPDV